MDPDDKDDAVGEGSADERRVAKTRQRVAARAKPAEDPDDDASDSRRAQPDPEEGKVVEIAIDDEDDDEESETPKSRKERRANRYREAQDRADAAEARARAAEDRERLAQQRYAAPPVQQAPQVNYADVEVDKAYQRRLELTRSYEDRHAAKTLTADDVKDFTSKLREAEEAHFAAVARRSAPRPQQVDPLVQHVRVRHADVLANKQAAAYAGGEFNKLLATGSQPSLETYEKAFNAARRQFRIGGASPTAGAATASQRARYEGAPRGPAGGATAPRVVRMTESNKRMADAAYPHIKDEHKRVGSKLLDR